MKTLQIGMDWFPEKGVGGLDRYYYEFTQSLPKVGVETDGLVTGSPIKNNLQGNIQTFASPNSFIFKRLYAVRKTANHLIKDNNYDLFASHFVLYTYPILDLLKHRPLVMHFHGPWSLESVIEGNRSLDIWLRQRMENAVFRQATSFIVLSKAFQEILHQTYQVPLEKIHIVPGGVDTQRLELPLSKSEVRTQLGWPQDRKILFTVRRLSSRMGLDSLISALKNIKAQHEDVLLLIAGKGELSTTLQTQIDELGLTKHVRLLGYIPDQQLTLAYRAADLTVIPTSTLEGFGLIVLESLAMGTPVVGTPVGGIPEILQPLGEDLIFEGYSTEHLTKGLLEVLSGDRRLPTHEVCIDYIHKNFTWDIIAKRIKTIYEEILDRH